MLKEVEKRLSRLEERVAERIQENKICNCRVTTSFHNAACLEAVLNGIRPLCPVHGFRELGFIMILGPHVPLGQGDNQFCPCPPHPWRSWVLKEGPDPTKAPQAEQEVMFQTKRDPAFDFKEEKRRIEFLLTEYRAAQQWWLEKSGRQPPSKQELVKLQWKRARQNARKA